LIRLKHFTKNILGLLFNSLILAHAHAEIITDGSVGAGTVLSGPNFSINADLGTQTGTNLFHSFSQFNLANGESATFSGAEAINNIISRVTGGEPSSINGAIISTIPDANFFFLNPAGVMFGENASIDIDGSFHVSTANSLLFANGERLAVATQTAPVLSVAAPSAFGFLGDPSGRVDVNGATLTVPEGQQISLVGTGIALGTSSPAQLVAPGGLIQLASVAAPGQVSLATLGQMADRLEAFASLGAIDIVNSASLDVSSTAGNGTISIRGGELHIENARLAADVLGNAAGAAQALDIALRGDVTLVGANVSANSFGAAAGGSVMLEANNVSLSSGAQISTFTFGLGAGGAIRVDARDELRLTGAVPGGQPSAILANSLVAGDAGSISVNAARVVITDGGQIGSGTFGIGRSGGVNIQASDEVLLMGTAPASCPDTNGCSSVIDANTFSSLDNAGAAGDILVEAPRVTLFNGGTISSTTIGAGSGGTVTVRAEDTLLLSGGASPAVGIGSAFFAVSPSAIVAVSVMEGNAGSIAVEANQVMLRAGGAISSTTFGAGQGGSVSVSASDTLTLTGSTSDGPSTIGASALNLTGSSADAGSVEINAPRVVLTDGARVDTLSRGSGRGGNLSITASDRILISDSSVTTQAAGNGTGGNINIITTNLLHLLDGEVTTSVAGGNGQGGNIDIDPIFIVLDGGRIQANAFGGPGGNIGLVSDFFLADPDSLVEASSALGIDGSVNIDSPETDVGDSLGVLPTSLQVSDVFVRSCERRARGASSLVTSGKGLQLDPDSYMNW